MMVLGALLAATLPGLVYFVGAISLGWGGPEFARSYAGSTIESLLVASLLTIVVAIGATAMLAGYAYYRSGVARYRYRRPFLTCLSLFALAVIVGRLIAGH